MFSNVSMFPFSKTVITVFIGHVQNGFICHYSVIFIVYPRAQGGRNSARMLGIVKGQRDARWEEIT